MKIIHDKINIASEFENTMLLNVEILRLTSIFQHITACEQHRDPI